MAFRAEDISVKTEKGNFKAVFLCTRKIHILCPMSLSSVLSGPFYNNMNGTLKKIKKIFEYMPNLS